MRRHQLAVVPLLLLFSVLSHAQQTPTDGQLRNGTGSSAQAYDAGKERWVSVEQFWFNYAERKGGYTYGPTESYPPYRQVNEGDTLLIELAQGPCLMEFFHSRWRLANDVRRWDDGFNDYGGCPHVFD